MRIRTVVGWVGCNEGVEDQVHGQTDRRLEEEAVECVELDNDYAARNSWAVQRSNVSGGSCWGDIDGVCLLSYRRRVTDGEIAMIRL